jgi:hypothetical protein
MTGHNTITKEQIDAFVTAWYLALDQHVPVEQAASLVSDDVEMIFPEKTLHGKSDFVAWCIGGPYSDGDKAPGVFNIFFDENHNVVSVEASIAGDTAELDVIVAWQASWFIPPAAKSKRVSLDAIQKWAVKASDQNPYGLVVTSYNAMAKPFVYAPGFARL